MSDTILILPDVDGGEAILARRSGSDVVLTRGDVDALAPLLGAPAAVILPGQRVRAFLTDVPERIKGAERLNVARFAHEDRLATQPSDLHIVVGAGDPAATLAVDRAVMDAVVARFDPGHVLADFDALADLAGTDIALLDRVVSPGPQGSSVDADWADGPVSHPDDDTLARSVFARLDSGEALDLRTGDYRRRLNVQTGPWARVAAMALVCGVLGLGGALADARATAAQADTIRADARALYTQATGQPAPANLARLASAAPTSDADAAAFLALSDLLFRSLSDHTDIRVERLSFDARENVLRLRLLYPGFGAATDLEATVARRGGTFSPGGVREQGGQYVGDAALSLNGAAS